VALAEEEVLPVTRTAHELQLRIRVGQPQRRAMIAQEPLGNRQRLGADVRWRRHFQLGVSDRAPSRRKRWV
jgi:hypothetical protein